MTSANITKQTRLRCVYPLYWLLLVSWDKKSVYSSSPSSPVQSKKFFQKLKFFESLSLNTQIVKSDNETICL